MPVGSEFLFKLQGNLLSEFLWQSHLKCFIETTSRTVAFLCCALGFEGEVTYTKN